MYRETTERMASSRMRRTLKSCRKRIFESAGKYGGDFPFFEGVMEELLFAVDKAFESLEPDDSNEYGE